jgi:hypothetical protein
MIFKTFLVLRKDSIMVAPTMVPFSPFTRRVLSPQLPIEFGKEGFVEILLEKGISESADGGIIGKGDRKRNR